MVETIQRVQAFAGQGLMILALIAGAACVVDWAIRTRRINPFSPVSRFFRRWIDPMMRPIETVIVRRGGQPAQAPFFAFMVVIVSGILVMWSLNGIAELVRDAAIGATGPGGLIRVLIGWGLRFLTFSLIVRVISSWLPVSPFSKWIRWSYVTTEWIIAPIRRVLPPFNGIDFSPLVAYLILMVAGSILGV